jgi:arginine-tRNA-protein transferase
MDTSAHERNRRRLAAALDRYALAPGASFPCPYLPGREARHLAFLAEPPPGAYHCLMDLNFRRVGEAFYRPACDGCGECRMIRVLCAELRPSRAQRRCLARNRDVVVTVGPPAPTPEKQRLYRRYLEARHADGQMDGSDEEFGRFLYASPLATVELEYRVGDRLISVGIADAEPAALSAVYCYFEPGEARRSPGVLNVLRLVEECRRTGRPWLYLGYHVRGSRKMSYKAGYRPHEVLGPDGEWVRGA